MKLIPSLLAASTLLTTTQGAPADADLKSLLQQGLYEEEAAREFDKAAVHYENLLSNFDSQRQLAATALFRLAEVRRKQNRKEDAVKLYTRLVAEFPQAEPLARLSRENLVALGAAASSAPMMLQSESAEDKEIRELEKLAQESPDLLLADDRLAKEAGAGKLKLVQFLLEKGADVHNSHALADAARAGRRAVCELLLAKGADVNGKANGASPLVAAASMGQLSVLQLLLDKGANPNSPGSALSAAINGNHLAIAKALIDKGADVNALNETPRPMPPMLPGQAMPRNPKSTKIQLPQVGTPLHEALTAENLPMVNLLLDSKADVNLATTQGNFTPLHLACDWGNESVIDRLLAAGAKVQTATTEAATTALYFAAKGKHLAICKKLLAAGAKFADDEAAILAAANEPELVAEMLAHGLPPNWQNKAGTTCLLAEAVYCSSVKICEMLLAAGAKVEGPCMNNFKTPMGLAFYKVRENWSMQEPQQIVDLLIRHGGDPLVPDVEQYAFLNSNKFGMQTKYRRTFLYPKLASQRAVHLTTPCGATVWELSKSDTEPTPASLDSLLLAWQAQGVLLEVATQFRSSSGISGDDVVNFSKLTLFRRKPDTGVMEGTEINLLTAKELPLLQWGDVLEASCKPYDPNLSINVHSVSAKPLPQQLTTALLGHRSVTISVAMENAPEQLRLSGRLAVYDPTKPVCPLGNAQSVFEALGGKHPKFIGATLRVKRPGWGELMSIEGLPSANIELLPGDQLVVTPAPNAEQENRPSWITLGSPGLPFALCTTNLGTPTLLQYLVTLYKPMVSSAEPTADWQQLLMEKIQDKLQVLPHPDLANIRIRRLAEDGKPEETIAVDLVAAMAKITPETAPEVARAYDVALKPGDIIEIPVKKDKLNEPWQGFDAPTLLLLRKAVNYRVNLTLDGKVMTVPYEYNAPGFVHTAAGLAIYQSPKFPWTAPTIPALRESLKIGNPHSITATTKDGAEIDAVYLQDQMSVSLKTTGVQKVSVRQSAAQQVPRAMIVPETTPPR